MNLVVCATGQLGFEICQQLSLKNKSFKAFVRTSSNPVKVNSLKKMGAKIIEGNLQNFNSLEKACKGIKSIISTASSIHSCNPKNNIEEVDKKGQLMLIDAAKSLGVHYFIFISISGNIEMDSPLRNAKREVENHLKNSGLTYTILRPTYFMEIWLSPSLGFDHTNTSATIYGDGQNPISWVSYRDVAKFAVGSVDNYKPRNKVIEIGGPKAFTPLQVIEKFKMIGGRKFNIKYIPKETIELQMENAPDPLQKTFAGLMLCYSKGDKVQMDEVVGMFQIKLTSLDEYIKSVVNK